MGNFIQNVEKDAFFQVLETKFRMPESPDEEKSLEQNILNAYLEQMREQKRIPSVIEVYSALYVKDFGYLYAVIEDTIDCYAKDLDLAERIRFYDENAKDVINNICIRIGSFIEHSEYKTDLMYYIKCYIVGLGYSIYSTDVRVNSINTIIGDAQILMPWRWTWGPCVVVGRNILADVSVKGGVLIG